MLARAIYGPVKGNLRVGGHFRGLPIRGRIGELGVAYRAKRPDTKRQDDLLWADRPWSGNVCLLKFISAPRDTPMAFITALLGENGFR